MVVDATALDVSQSKPKQKYKKQDIAKFPP